MEEWGFYFLKAVKKKQKNHLVSKLLLQGKLPSSALAWSRSGVWVYNQVSGFCPAQGGVEALMAIEILADRMMLPDSGCLYK